jgi:hypothetical protein
MTYAAPTSDFYDDGLVHSHHWSRSTPPGEQHNESRAAGAREHDGTTKDHARS